MTRKPLALALIPLLALASACSRRSQADYDHVPDAAVVADGDAKVDAEGGDASVLNPLLDSDSVSSDVDGMIFNGLVRYNPKLQLEGELAKDWKVEQGGKRIIFHLRPGVKWQDGQPFTSADVAFTFKALMDPKLASPRKGPFELVRSVEAPDPLTVVVNYAKPFVPALESWGQGMLPEHLLKGQDLNKADFNKRPVGTGPYKFVRWLPNQSIELAANPDYFEGKPHLKRVLVRIIPDTGTKLMELKAGGIDSMALSPDQYKNQAQGPEYTGHVRLFRYPSLSTYTYLGFNLARVPFNDKRVRMALSRAIDRQALINAILLGYGKPCTGPYSPGMPAYNQAVKAVPFDLSASASLLDAAGWKLGPDGIRAKAGKRLSFALLTNQGNKVREDVAAVLQQQFRKIGVEAQPQTVEWSLFITQYLDKKNFDVVIMGWQLGLDPDIYDIWHSSKTHPGEFNFISYKDARVDQLLEQGRTCFDPARRMAIYREIHARIAADEPMAFLFAPDEISALHKRFHGMLVTDTGIGWYWPLRWYVPRSIQLYP
jgi:peptide/nickel transport system substrate-binding protein